MNFKNKIGKHVCVSYSSFSFGDWLRYFISLHDGFEEFDTIKNYGTHSKLIAPFYCYKLEPERSVNMLDIFDIEHFYEKFDYICVNHRTLRQVWKPTISKNFSSSSIWGCTWKKIAKENLDLDYNIIRQTDHKFIFVKLNPKSVYAEIYFERHRASVNAQRGDEKIHRECFEDCWKLEYPKHEDNLPLEINKLWEGDHSTYINMCRFIEMKPLDNWKEPINEFNNIFKPD
jgi:hypothetical protein